MKRITAIILTIILAALCLSGCEKKKVEVEIVGEDTSVISRLENVVELRKSLFRAKITKAETKNAIITKYNADNLKLSNYTVYTADIVESYDDYTPTGTVNVYWAGTDTEFVSRVNLLEGETYILDAEPWVYGDEIIYILAPLTASYPKADAEGNLTIAISEVEALSVGTLDSYREEYDKAVAAVNERIEGFDTVKNAAERYVTMFKEVLDKNSDKTIYNKPGFEWKPDSDFIDKTIARSQAVYDEAVALVRDDVTKEEITELLK